MHYFFLERFLQPAEWFEKRLAYSRSVAASSMVIAFYFFMHAYFCNIWTVRPEYVLKVSSAPV